MSIAYNLLLLKFMKGLRRSVGGQGLTGRKCPACLMQYVFEMNMIDRLSIHGKFFRRVSPVTCFDISNDASIQRLQLTSSVTFSVHHPMAPTGQVKFLFASSR